MWFVYLVIFQIVLAVIAWFVLLYVNEYADDWYETNLGHMIMLCLVELVPFIGVIFSIISLCFCGYVALTSMSRFKVIPTIKRKSKY